MKRKRQQKCPLTCTFGPVVMFISTATSFSLASIFSELFDSTNDEPPAVRNANARFFLVGELFTATVDDDVLRSADWRRFDGDADAGFDRTESCRDGVVTLELFSVNGIFDTLLMPSF